MPDLVEQALRPESLLEDFFENGSIGLHIVGPDGIILRANKAELSLMGYGAEEYVGRRVQDFHADEAAITDILARLGRGETLDKYPARLRTKDGAIKYVLISSSASFDDHGAFLNTRCFTLDVTELRRLEERRDLLVAELNHRVMNTLAVVESLARQSFKGARAPAEGQSDFLERLRALSAAHKLLGRNEWAFATLQGCLEIALSPYPDHRWTLEGPGVALAAPVAIDLALVFNELSTNAAKHGALASTSGQVSVAWRLSDQDSSRVQLTWREQGAATRGRPQPGFGAKLLEQVVSHQPQGKVATEFRDDGMVCQLEFLTDR